MPGPRWGAYDAPPDPLVGWGGGYPLHIPHPLDAFGVSTLRASNSMLSASRIRRSQYVHPCLLDLAPALPRPLASAASRRMPRSLMAADDVAMEAYYYGRQSVAYSYRKPQWIVV